MITLCACLSSKHDACGSLPVSLHHLVQSTYSVVNAFAWSCLTRTHQAPERIPHMGKAPSSTVRHALLP